MSKSESHLDLLDSVRLTSFFEWTFAILVANLTVQLYRLVAQFATLLFDVFKLSHGADLFWPLTTDDLKPYSHYFSTQNEIIYRLVEGLVLTVSALYGASCLLDGSVVGLFLSSLVFFTHSLLSITGFVFAQDYRVRLISLEFLIWLVTICVELTVVFLSVTYSARLGLTIIR